MPVPSPSPRPSSPSAQLYAPVRSLKSTPAGTPPASPAKDARLVSSTVSLLSSPGRPTTAAVKAKLAFRTAAKSFLLRDQQGTWTALNKGEDLVLSSLKQTGGDELAWWRPEGSINEEQKELLEVWRKLRILRITFVATLFATPSTSGQDIPSDPKLLKLLSMQPEPLVYALWAALASPSDSGSSPSTALPLSDPSLLALHPSLATATALAALKVNSPQAARRVCEAWLGTVMGNDDVLDSLSASPPEHDPAVNAMNGAVEAGPTTPLAAYERLVEVYSVHVLGALDEWAEAVEFIRGQGKASGGIVEDSRVEV